MATETPRGLAHPRMSAAVYALASLAGLGVMLFPLWRSWIVPETAPAPGAGAPLVLALLVTFCFVALALEASSGGLGARTVAALGVLVAINSLLRLVEVAVPGPAGFTPVFFLVILAGYVFGARFGFLMGALTMAVSAAVTGGLGPWLPYQMLAAGWVGLTAGWLPGGGRDRARPSRREVAMLTVFGGLWGFGYGLLMTPWSWGYFEMGSPGEATIGRFLAFYVATSMLWDVFAAGGTALLMVLAGAPVLGALRRMGRWFDFRHDDAGVVCVAPGIFGPEPHSPGAVSDAVSSATRRAPVETGSAPDETDVEADGQQTTPETAPGTSVDSAEQERRAADADLVPSTRTGVVHPYAWVAWAAGVVALASATRNPVVLVGTALAVVTVSGALPRSGRDHVGLSIGRMALFVIPIAALYNLLSAHYGANVLVRLPVQLPVIGGPLTLESFVYGIAIGLSLVVLIAAFSTVARAIPVRALTSLVPRAFGALSLTASISLAYLPAARRQLDEVREAQAVRGHRARGVRSWLPLVLPLLIGGLERSVTLAESLTARGLAPPSQPMRPALRLVVPIGMAVVLVGWLGAVTGALSRAPVAVLVIGGAVLAMGALLRLGRKKPRTAFRRDPVHASDVLVALAAWAPLAVAWFTEAGRAVVDYSPLPRLSVPAMDPLFAVALAGLVVPVAVIGRRMAAPAPHADSAGRGHRSGDALPTGNEAATRPAQVRFRSFSYAYPDARRPALADVTFDAMPGALTLLTGASGSGKSTLLRAVNGLVPHFTGGVVRGAVRVAARDPVVVGPGAMGDVVGFVSGDPERTFVMDTVADEVAFALEYRGLSRPDMGRRIRWALRQVSLDGFGDRAIATLSGGERQRVAVAAALAMAPRVLVLDEPTSQVDDETASGMTAAIRALTEDERVTVLVSEHRLDRLLPHASMAVHLRSHDAPVVLTTPDHVLDYATGPPVPAPPRRDLGPPVLQCDRLRFSYVGRHVLRDVSVRLHEGEVVALMGSSGSGKTTLLRLAVGLLEPDAGDVRVAGRAIRGRDVADVCREVGYLPQDPNALLFADTVLDELRVTLGNHAHRDESDATAMSLLEDLGIAELATKYPRDLSTGQRQRTALAAVAVTRPAVLLLDEPTRGLDGAAIADLARTLHALAGAGAGVLIATHDRRLAAAAHRTLRLANGSVSTLP